ncbi:DUF4136 domain-containing protein [Kordia zhangzhouensis]|uniref:DUF4136 domain-containing protein n=1 Tax=Kordia zhangzhouensis TaxID=1620405 RepID=UPI0006292773|nr:DUF4136 domain-containing protein [Kordia zhangzhouensis]
MKYINLVLFLLIFAACTTPRVVYDYDHKTNFSNYKTYNLYPEIETGLSELDNKRLLRVTDSIMQERGFVRTATPDFYINIETHFFEPDRNNAIGVGVGGTGRNVGGGISIGLPVGDKHNQQFVFDFVDVRQDELFWQAVVEGFYKEQSTPEEREVYFIQILQKVLEGYPPKK